MKKISSINLIVLISLFPLASCQAQIEIIPVPESSQKKASNVTPTESETTNEENTLVGRLLAKNEDYDPGDPLSWELVAPVLAELRQSGVQLPPDSELQPRFLKESDPFYKMISSKKGEQFFADLSKSPAAIDRAERYLSFPDGRRELEFIMTRKGGAEFFTDMVETRNGRKTAEIIASNPGLKDFDKPTGKIYLASQLNKFLESDRGHPSESDSKQKPVRLQPKKYD